VYCKLSGLVTVAAPDFTVADLRPYAEETLAAFGPDRVMFGSDWPGCLVEASYARVAGIAVELTDQLNPAERDLVFGGTVAKVYRLVEA
jgi:L-fuconolactonase